MPHSLQSAINTQGGIISPINDGGYNGSGIGVNYVGITVTLLHLKE